MSTVFYLLLRRLRMPLLVLICVYSISILGFVMIPGQDDHGHPWEMSFFHAFYFVSFMGSTIGFGEIPYPFTDAQRFWAIVAIYGTVISWLYGIGTMLAIIQDNAFQRLLVESQFKRRVKRIAEPFYLICGYGETGQLLTKSLSNEGIQLVIIDINEERINEIEVCHFLIKPLALCADTSRLKYLKMGGLLHPHCKGVIALTKNDQTNLTIATAVHLLNKNLRLISRAESIDVEENITSFGRNEVINPYETFSKRLTYLIEKPGMYTLFDWLTGIPNEILSEPSFPKKGRWILCGYGQFGRSIHHKFIELGIDITVVTPKKEDIIYLEKVVSGVGVKIDVLEKAGVRKATGIIAGTSNDANNLSIIMTAKELNPDIFIISRQNQRSHFPIFNAAQIDLIMQRGNVIAQTIFALVRSPLLGEFMRLTEYQSHEWANKLVSRLAALVDDEMPHLWEISIDQKHTPALFYQLEKRKTIKLKDILRDPNNRQNQLSGMALLLYRKERGYLLPDADQKIKFDDRILFCGNRQSRRQHHWIVQDEHIFRYLLTGKECSGGYVWQWLSQRFNKAVKTKKTDEFS